MVAGPEGAARVDFYVLEGSETRTRLKLACRLCEKAHAAGQQVLVWLEDPAELASFDELLWTFADRSFVPHETLGEGAFGDCPVRLSCQRLPDGPVDVLVNLASAVPAAAVQARRIIEVIDAEPARRQSGRSRFRVYRERGLNPQTHHIAADESA